MAEVKTYKCDICDEVYYSDDAGTEMLITIMDKDGKLEGYNHICPSCHKNIEKYIENPKIDRYINTGRLIKQQVIENTKAELQRERRARVSLEGCLSALYNLGICPIFRSFWYASNDPEYYEKVTDEIKGDFRDMEKSRDEWKIIAITAICFAIGMIIANIAKLFV